MHRGGLLAAIVLTSLMLGLCTPARAADTWLDPSVRKGVAMINGEPVGFLKQGAIVQLTTPNYDWWYGCSPTSAGMLMGYYDRKFMWNAQTYYNLVPGGSAELSSFGAGGPFICNDAIASAGHIADYWIAYGNPGPDPLASGRTLPADYDCLADFMGTSQAAYNNTDGGTSFWYRIDGQKTYPSNIITWGHVGDDGMYGMYDYTDYRGYGSGNPNGDTNFYSQVLPGVDFDPGDEYPPAPTGFTFDEYKAEIDAGKPVVIHVEGHSMLGYGYDDTGANQTVFVYDTWDDNDGGGPHQDGLNPGHFQWGTNYDGMEHYAVTCANLTGGNAAFIIREPPWWWMRHIEPWPIFSLRWDMRNPQWDHAPYLKEVPPQVFVNQPGRDAAENGQERFSASKSGDIEYSSEMGVWGVEGYDKEGKIDIYVENISDTSLVKQVFLQFRMFIDGDADCDVSLDTDLAALVAGGEVNLIGTDGDWGIYEAWWTIDPQPWWETFTFTLATGPDGGAVYIANVDVGTFCPEPATLSLLALGGLVVLRRRRRA